MKEIHLIPDCHDEGWHTTKDCWCQPPRVEIRVAIFQTERVVFHQEVNPGRGSE